MKRSGAAHNAPAQADVMASGLHCLGGGLDAILAGVVTPSAADRLQRYAAAQRSRPCPWHALRVQFGRSRQRAIKAGLHIGYAAWQRQMPAHWPRTRLGDASGRDLVQMHAVHHRRPAQPEALHVPLTCVAKSTVSSPPLHPGATSARM